MNLLYKQTHAYKIRTEDGTLCTDWIPHDGIEVVVPKKFQDKKIKFTYRSDIKVTWLGKLLRRKPMGMRTGWTDHYDKEIT